MTLSPGQKLAHFRVIREIGAGGMGVVFLVRDEHLDRDVALKVLPAGALADPASRRRFRSEALALSKLSHPNIAVVHDFDVQDGVDFLVMECVPGTTLRDRLAGGLLQEAEIRKIGAQLAAALAAAHDQGILHRDIKPGNLILTPDGRLKVLDFGIARLFAPSPETTVAETVTVPGALIGTPAYMAPEQLRGESVDARADIYAAGVVLYELATGSRPHAESNPALLVDAILNRRPVPPRERRPELSVEFERIVLRALERAPEARYAHARDLQCALERQAPAPAAQERVRIVVLPIENLGGPEEEYFAAGLTEEIASRLAMVGGLGVISRTSARRYARSTKTIREIGEELGVSYVLEGTVRWDPRSPGHDRVRICTELVRVSDETQILAERQERVIDDIFAVQSEIAQQVVRALGLTLRDADRRSIEIRLTTSPAAYQAYLRARHLASQPHFSVETWKDAIANCEEAVRLDPDFVRAWAELARGHARFYHLKADPSQARREMAREALARAEALAPWAPEVHLARAYCHMWLGEEEERTLEELAAAECGFAEETEILLARATYLEARGRWDEAREVGERAFSMSPRDADVAGELILIEWITRRYERATSYCDKALAIAPDAAYRVWPNLFRAFAQWSWKGATPDARSAIDQVPRDHEWAPWARFWQAMYEGRCSEALADISSAPGEWVRNKMWAAPLPLFAAFAHDALGESEDARRAYASARTILARSVEAQPVDPRLHSSLGLACAGLGLTAEALDHGRSAVELLPISKDAMYGIAPLQDLSMICAAVGALDAALDALESLLSIPSWLSPVWLRNEPRYRPLAGHPRFQRLAGL